MPTIYFLTILVRESRGLQERKAAELYPKRKVETRTSDARPTIHRIRKVPCGDEQTWRGQYCDVAHHTRDYEKIRS